MTKLDCYHINVLVFTAMCQWHTNFIFPPTTKGVILNHFLFPFLKTIIKLKSAFVLIELLENDYTVDAVLPYDQ
jgi:hypothetical protein